MSAGGGGGGSLTLLLLLLLLLLLKQKKSSRSIAIQFQLQTDVSLCVHVRTRSLVSVTLGVQHIGSVVRIGTPPPLSRSSMPPISPPPSLSDLFLFSPLLISFSFPLGRRAKRMMIDVDFCCSRKSKKKASRAGFVRLYFFLGGRGADRN